MCHLSVLLFYKHLYYNIIILLLKRYIQKNEVDGDRRTWNEYSTGNVLCTVCLDSMSPFSLFFNLLLSLFSHIVRQWYFLYLRITGQKKSQTNPSPIPLQLAGSGGKRIKWGWGERSNDKLESLWRVPTVLVRTHLRSVRWETGNMQRFHLDSILEGAQQHCLGSVYSVDSSIMFVSVHVGATSALLCAREGKRIPMMAKVHFLLYTTTMTLNVSQYGFCIWENMFWPKYCVCASLLLSNYNRLSYTCHVQA